MAIDLIHPWDFHFNNETYKIYGSDSKADLSAASYVLAKRSNNLTRYFPCFTSTQNPKTNGFTESALHARKNDTTTIVHSCDCIVRVEFNTRIQFLFYSYDFHVYLLSPPLLQDIEITLSINGGDPQTLTIPAGSTYVGTPTTSVYTSTIIADATITAVGTSMSASVSLSRSSTGTSVAYRNVTRGTSIT